MLRAQKRAGLALILSLCPALRAQSVTITEYPIPAAKANPFGITTGPDGALWFTEDVGNIGRISTAGTIKEYGGPSHPTEIAVGPDGALWFTEFNKIGRITTAGLLTEYPIPTSGSGAFGIAAGPDGALWFAEESASKIGRITTAGVLTEYSTPTPNSYPLEITAGPDGALWFTEEIGKIGRITTGGTITEFPVAGSAPLNIVVGTDGALWFTGFATAIVRITTAGVVTKYPVPNVGSEPDSITVGPDGALWFTEALTDSIGRLSATGALTEYAFPTQSTGFKHIALGPDGALWVTEYMSNKIARVAVAASTTSVTASPSILSFSVAAGGSSSKQISVSSGASFSWSATTSSNWITLNPSSGTTPGNITVSVNAGSLQPGTYTGTITISNSTASPVQETVSVTLIVQPNTPVISTGGIVNASFASGAFPASPGSLVAIFGANLAASTQGPLVDGSGHLSTSLAGTSVQIGSIPAPLLYVSPTQVNAQIPFELKPGTYAVSVTTANGPSSTVSVSVSATSPGVFPGAVVNNTTGALINAGNPFRPGDVIVVYLTGLGAVSPAGITGQLAPASPLSSVIAAPTITIGGLPVQVANAVLSVGFVGLYQIGIVIPGGLPQGTQPLVVTSGGVQSAALQVASGPALDPQYCADVSGAWNVTESGSVREIVTSDVENDDFTNSFNSQGTINIAQNGCAISYTPTPIPGLVTAAQAAALVRTGTLSGTTVTLQGLLTLPDLAVSAVPGLTITQVSQNQVQASGQVTGAVLTTTDQGKFTGSGTYSKNGQKGSFTITYILTGTARLVRPGVGPIPSARTSASANGVTRNVLVGVDTVPR